MEKKQIIEILKKTPPYPFKSKQLRRVYMFNSIVRHQYWFRDKRAWRVLIHIKALGRLASRPITNPSYLTTIFSDFNSSPMKPKLRKPNDFQWMGNYLGERPFFSSKWIKKGFNRKIYNLIKIKNKLKNKRPFYSRWVKKKNLNKKFYNSRWVRNRKNRFNKKAYNLFKAYNLIRVKRKVKRILARRLVRLKIRKRTPINLRLLPARLSRRRKMRGKLRWAILFSRGRGILTPRTLINRKAYFTRRPLVDNFEISWNRKIFNKSDKHTRVFSVIPTTFRGRRGKRIYYLIVNMLRRLTTGRLSYRKRLRLYKYLSKFLLYRVRRSKSGMGVVLNYSKNNYFISVVSRSTGAFIKLFSSGALKHKTTRRRRNFNSLIECWEKMVKYLKSRRVKQLRFVKILHKKHLSRIHLNKIGLFKQLSRVFKKNKIFVTRWINVVIRAHGLLPRAPKLRRK